MNLLISMKYFGRSSKDGLGSCLADFDNGLEIGDEREKGPIFYEFRHVGYVNHQNCAGD